ncbi:hypothetical protein E4K67_16255 [Desulfosporosinus fructosivorans]|uniref:Lipoprotein n=1 Tax=Desulfosporosinus fructosivorans TaxID=2018669 RepID=A0A4Z0R2T1_9FIRM|nr:hypothetical protein [Desulfosporosinus fructosivorans]TGE37382.1 hypothetical protein E4K67_16255 [Desulfosporosinus fructosivorans]
MKRHVSTVLMCLILLLTCFVTLTGCGSDSPAADSKTAEADKKVETKKNPKELIVGKWSTDGGSIEFNSKGEAIVTESGERSQFTYKATSEGKNGGKDSIKVSLTDSDKQSSSETITFLDDNTIEIGGTEFKRAGTVSTNTNTNAESGKGKSVTTANAAIARVIKLLGNGNNKYSFELDHEDQVIPDGKGNYNANRDNGKVANGIDCYIIRVYTEEKQGDSISQDNIGWYFVSKSTGEVYEMKDPYEQELKMLN